jgi:lipopolysaccharide transport system ATP-binding protein
LKHAVIIEGLGKTFRKGEVRLVRSTFREALTNRLRKLFNPRVISNSSKGDDSLFWALKDIDLAIEEGEVIGIIGRNGAGKSTLLKILSRITPPTCGSIRYKGKIASLLEVGTGFHGELTGKENIFLNGEILGMRRSEISRKCGEIVEFAEVGDFLDTPVKFYSSGMYLRLAFAVAAHLEPDILVVDEVLAVGDASFQKRCIGKMGDVARSGRTILFVSHNMGAVSQLCSRAVLLQHGKLISQGKVHEVLGVYSKLNNGQPKRVEIPVNQQAACSILNIRTEDKSGRECWSFDLESEIIIRIRYQVRKALPFLQITATMERNLVEIVHSFDTDQLQELPTRLPGLYEAIHRIPGMFLKAGTYAVRITAGTPDLLIQDLPAAIQLEVEELSHNTHMRGYRGDRAGHVISQGTWETKRID